MKFLSLPKLALLLVLSGITVCLFGCDELFFAGQNQTVTQRHYRHYTYHDDYDDDYENYARWQHEAHARRAAYQRDAYYRQQHDAYNRQQRDAYQRQQQAAAQAAAQNQARQQQIANDRRMAERLQAEEMVRAMRPQYQAAQHAHPAPNAAV